MCLAGAPGGNFGSGYGAGYGGGAMKGPGYGQRAAGPYGGTIVSLSCVAITVRTSVVGCKLMIFSVLCVPCVALEDNREDY